MTPRTYLAYFTNIINDWFSFKHVIRNIEVCQRRNYTEHLNI